MVDLADQLDAEPEVRLVPSTYRTLFGRHPTGVWRAPGTVVPLADADAALAVGVRWGAIAAASPREDGVLELRSMSHPAESVTVDSLAVGSVPSWAVSPLAVVGALRAAGHPIGGASILLSVDVPAGAGMGPEAAAGCAVGLAMRDLWAPVLTDAELLAVGYRSLGGAGDPTVEAGRWAGALLGREGTAVRVIGARPELVPLDLSAAGLRLVVVDTGLTSESGRPASRLPAGSAESRLAAGDMRPAEPEAGGVRWAELAVGGLAALGPLMSVVPAWDGDPPRAALIQAALAAGALGARPVWDPIGAPALLLVAVDRLVAVRRAATEAALRAGGPQPRYLTVVPAAGGGRAGSAS